MHTNYILLWFIYKYSNLYQCDMQYKSLSRILLIAFPNTYSAYKHSQIHIPYLSWLIT